MLENTNIIIIFRTYVEFFTRVCLYLIKEAQNVNSTD